MPRPLANDNESASRTPDRGHPDRKRALNVLAQRRYRQRKRERIATLEARAGSLEANSAESEVINSETHQIICSSSESQSPETRSAHGDSSSGNSNDGHSQQSFDPAFQLFGSSHQLLNFSAPFDVSSWDDMPDSISTVSQPLQRESIVDAPFSLDSYSQPVGFSPDITRSSTSGPSSMISYTAPTFSNDLELSIPVLKTMRVGLSIIQLLEGLDQVYDVSARWTMGNADFSCLPPSFQPSPIQLSVPHHPMLDIIPWSSLRDKLILMYAMPPALRPKIAQDDSTSLMQLGHDYEDPTEPFVVNGSDGWSEDDWELGGAFLRNWWWAVDQEIITRTNAQRLKRGMPRLQFTSST